jgi:hypothetical protein
MCTDRAELEGIVLVWETRLEEAHRRYLETRIPETKAEYLKTLKVFAALARGEWPPEADAERKYPGI